MKRVTLKDISRLANVSETTVSLVLNDKADKISDEKIKEIKDIAKKLNYRPNLLARSLASNKTNTIGLVIPDIENPFFSSLAKIIQKELMKNDFMLFIGNSDDLIEQDKKIISKLLDYNVDGIIYCPSNESYKLNINKKEGLLKLNTPILIIDRIFEDVNLNQISFDNEHGGYIATKHIIDKGFKHIACITGDLDTYTAKKRYEGYKKALNDYNIPFNDSLVFEGDYKFSTGKKIAKKIMDNKKIDSVFISNDLMAYGFINGIDRLGKESRNIYVIGYDNLEINKNLGKKFTSVSQNLDELGKEAVNNILNQINGKKDIEKKLLKPKI